MSDKPHYIIAIGASAGGLDEINIFFDHTPLDGVAYIIVQHLSPDFKSRMVELIAKHSKLEVLSAGNNMLVETNKVYIIPHDKYMTISRGRLLLSDKGTSKGPHLTINTFFESLAKDCGKHAIAVILSGLGTDGSDGARSIKYAGGMVIARNPVSAEFDSMPASAIDLGLVDFVLDPELMPDAIEEYVKQADELAAQNEEDKLTFSAITGLINERSPLDFSDYKPATILRRIKRRAEYNNFKSLPPYLDFLKDSPDEIEALSKDFLISVTSFFRDKNAFETIQAEILPKILVKLQPGEELKLWVSGCATGEEAYSMAILIAELLTGELKNTVVKIFATDIDTAALRYAAEGIYSANITKDVTPERLARFFTASENRFRVNPEIRRMVIFAEHDLVKNPPYCNMQLISCRNLLIYMTLPLQKKIFLMLLFGLKIDGYLFLGASENPISIIENLAVINKKWKLYKNIQTKRVVRFDAFSLPELRQSKNSIPFSQKQNLETASSTLDEIVNATLANELDYLVVCVDEHNHVIKTYGDTSKFLLQRNFHNDLTELLPRQAAIVFNTLRVSATKDMKKKSIHGLQVSENNIAKFISISVSPIVMKNGAKILMVSFSEDQQIQVIPVQTAPLSEQNYYDEYTHNLEEELKEVKDKLYQSNLRLDASNESMQSFNEELLSTNEEMQSTNEEMQSVNEELQTINNEYQYKNKELHQTNDDLNNYFKSNLNGQLFVNRELLLMKFSPGAVKLINLLPGDIGRPLSNISTNIKLDTIIEDIKKLLVDGKVLTKEIQTGNGRWYHVMTMPYTLADNSNDGAVVTFNDITELKEIQFELDKKNLSLLRINEDLDNFVHTASHDLLAPLGNIEMSIDIMNSVNTSDPTLVKYLAIINNSIKKFRGLITDIAYVAKVEADMLSTDLVNLNELTDDIEWSLETKLHAGRIVISRDFAVQDIRFSKKNLRSILYNLISNSIKFRSEENPVIIIRSYIEKDFILLTVQDNGIGIHEDYLSQIFDIYGRVNYAIDGEGIGLYLSKKIIDAAGGNIVVESQPGLGSKFTVFFSALPPVVVAEPALN